MSGGPIDAPTLSRPAQAHILLPFILITLIWGCTWLVIRGQLGLVPPAWSVCYRFLLGAATMLLFARITDVPLRMKGRDHLFALAIGLCQFALNFNLLYPAEALITSGLAALIFALLVVPNTLLGWIFLRQGISRPFLLGALLALAGLTLMFAKEIAHASFSGDAVLGILLTLGALLSASAANVMQASGRAAALPALALLGWAMLWGSLVNAAWAWATVGPPVFDPQPGYVAGLLFLGIIASALAFTLYIRILQEIGPGRAAYSNVLIPLIAMALSTMFEGYRWTWEAAIGGALALAGLLISLSARSPAR